MTRTLLVTPCGLSLYDNQKAVGDDGNLDPRFAPFRSVLRTEHWKRDFIDVKPVDADRDGVIPAFLADPQTAADLAGLRSALDDTQPTQAGRAHFSAETTTVAAGARKGTGGWYDCEDTSVLLLASDTPLGVATACLVGTALAPSSLRFECLGRPGDGSVLVDGELLGFGELAHMGSCTIMVVPGLRVDRRTRAGVRLEAQLAEAARHVSRRVASELTDETIGGLCVVVTGGYKVFIPYLTVIAPYFRCVSRATSVTALATHDETRPAEAVAVPLLEAELPLARQLQLLHRDKRETDDAWLAFGGLALRRRPGGVGVDLVGVGPALAELLEYLRPDLRSLPG